MQLPIIKFDPALYNRVDYTEREIETVKDTNIKIVGSAHKKREDSLKFPPNYLIMQCAKDHEFLGTFHDRYRVSECPVCARIKREQVKDQKELALKEALLSSKLERDLGKDEKWSGEVANKYPVVYYEPFTDKDYKTVLLETARLGFLTIGFPTEEVKTGEYAAEFAFSCKKGHTFKIIDPQLSLPKMTGCPVCAKAEKEPRKNEEQQKCVVTFAGKGPESSYDAIYSGMLSSEELEEDNYKYARHLAPGTAAELEEISKPSENS